MTYFLLWLESPNPCKLSLTPQTKIEEFSETYCVR